LKTIEACTDWGEDVGILGGRGNCLDKETVLFKEVAIVVVVFGGGRRAHDLDINIILTGGFFDWDVEGFDYA
jgi:hypothetical protein